MIVTDKMIAALDDAITHSPFDARRNKAHDDGRQWEVIEQTNADWRDVIGTDEDFKLHGRFATEAEADALYKRLNLERIFKIVVDAAVTPLLTKESVSDTADDARYRLGWNNALRALL